MLITVARYKRLCEKASEAREAAEAARKMLAINCNHPKDFVEDFHWTSDDGYGTQRERVGKICQICFARDHYAEGRFVEAKDCTY